jgi:hypothetical protein
VIEAVVNIHLAVLLLPAGASTFATALGDPQLLQLLLSYQC